MKRFGLFLLLLAAGLLAVAVGRGCGMSNVKDPDENPNNGAGSQCPEIPEAGPYAVVSIGGLDLDQPAAEKAIKDKAGKVIGTLSVDLSRKKDGLVMVRLDFGVMAMGSTRSHSFKITNTGDGRLKVAKYKSSCQCTVADVKADGLKKGESTDVKLEWSPKGMMPEFQQTAEICTNDPKRRLIAFGVMGRVAQSVEVYPEGHWPVSEPAAGKEAVVEGWIGSRVHDDLEIKSLKYPREFVRIESVKMTAKELKQQANASGVLKSGYKLKATVLPQNEIGRFEHKVSIKTSADPNAEFHFHVVGLRKGPIDTRLKPSPGVRYYPGNQRLDLGDVSTSKGKSASILLYVRGLADTPLKITPKSLQPAYLTIRLERDSRPEKSKGSADKNPSHVYRLTFTIPPYPANRPLDAYTSSKPANVVVETNHPRAKTITFELLLNPIEDR